MADITLVVERWGTNIFDPILDKEQHLQRAKLVHGLVDVLDLDVKSWGNTDSDDPHEIVEIIIGLGSAGVFTAIVAAFKVWIERDKITDVTIKTTNGEVSLRGATARDVVEITRELGL